MENRKPRIYFSKSRAGNFDDILKVKNYLAKFDCEIIEFTGGIYTPEKLDSSDLLLILPPDLSKYEFVGRGQYEEFLRSLDDVIKWENPFIITSITTEGTLLGVIVDEGRIIDKNWTTDYGHFFLIDRDEEEALHYVFELKYKSVQTIKSMQTSYPDFEISKENDWEKTMDVILNKYPSDIQLEPTHPEILQLTYDKVFNSLNLL